MKHEISHNTYRMQLRNLVRHRINHERNRWHGKKLTPLLTFFKNLTPPFDNLPSGSNRRTHCLGRRARFLLRLDQGDLRLNLQKKNTMNYVFGVVKQKINHQIQLQNTQIQHAITPMPNVFRQSWYGDHMYTLYNLTLVISKRLILIDIDCKHHPQFYMNKKLK